MPDNLPAPLNVFVTDEKPKSLLSPARARVYGCIADGMTTKEIARRLKLSDKTVGCHLDAIRKILGAESVWDVRIRAMRQRIREEILGEMKSHA